MTLRLRRKPMLTPRMSLEGRICFVCEKYIPERQGTYHVRLRILTHTEPCSHTVEAFEKDFSKSTRGRQRSASAILRLVRELKGQWIR